MAKDGVKKNKPQGEVLACSNPKAQRDYEFEERFEAGLVLRGSEVKALRARKGDLDGAYASVDGGELYLHKMHIGPYEQAGTFGHDTKRTRKLLVHRRQIETLTGQLAHKGYTLVPLRVYFKGGRAKVELGLGKGKKHGDKRETIRRELDLKDAREAMKRG
jgi:SsrA-binding protein